MGALRGGSEIYVLIAKTKHGSVPVGIIEVSFHGWIAEPRATFFSHASPRNVLESYLRFFIELKKAHKVMFFSPPGYWRVFDHLCKYGVLRRVGTSREYYGRGMDNAGFYESVG